MIGLGTIINVLAIIAGGLIGLFSGNRLNEKCRTGLMSASGICVLFIGIIGTCQQMLYPEGPALQVRGTLMMLISFAVGTLLGAYFDLEGKIVAFGEYLKKRARASGDAGFVNAFVVASLTVCIGAMAVVGAIQDGIRQDISILTAKALLDFVIIMILAASMGRGCVFSAIPVGIFQGAITLLAVFIEPILTQQALDNISLTGSILIACVGINIIWGQKMPVANMLPTLLFAAVFAYF